MTLRVALIQHDISWNDVTSSIGHIEPLLYRALEGGAELLICAEMLSTGFSSLTGTAAANAASATIKWARDFTQRHSCALCGSLPMPSITGFAQPFNRFMLWHKGESVSHYDKQFLFSLSEEKQRYTAGSTNCSFEFNGLRITPFICYDLRFAHVWTKAATTTDCYILVANWPAQRSHHWRTLVQARAIENQCFVLAVNRIGRDPTLEYAGNSLAVGPDGEVLAELSRDPGIAIVEVDSSKVASWREQFPALRDRLESPV